MTTTSEIGLRELKKLMTREDIADAALRLTLEKGLSNVTIDEIANEALVSPRTFSNYFTCKEEAVAAAGTGDPREIIERFAQRPADERPLQALCAVLSDYVRSLTPDQLRLRSLKIGLEQDNPTLRPYQVARYAAFEEALRSAVAERTGTDVDSDAYPWLVAAAAVAAVAAAIRLWMKTEAAPGRLPDLVQDAFNQISAGLSVPGRGTGAGHDGEAV